VSSSAVTQADKTVQQVAVLSTIRQAFVESPYRSLHRLSCHLSNDVIVLSGQLPSFYLKSMAQEVARKFAENLALRNDIVVKWP
jgi:hypothetical protein